ncbi:esterase-like activity of phytase family protein [Sphingomonas sp. NSE70-1]|uniref:Esterase-like activity of phytase family protein n=1 Tax=Sphingomonas caseinilyticus TaxID=2908205 RepID=A0ABT0RVJ3_9SPHN|nr:esterase-like activity of phytase family protein [Sphingomonas caseinilyticus]MCL6699042.1 esterase-like activity of phytase family protein [Sphingomonas caseinilyticus]
MREMPQRPELPAAQTALTYRPADVAPVPGPLRIVGAWVLTTDDRRFGGLSSLTLDEGRFLAVSDRGAVARFDPPTSAVPVADIADLRAGPGPWGKKWSRDAESLAPDPEGRGWWIGYEQRHSLWLYDPGFSRAISSVDLNRDDWWENRGAEALIADGDGLLVLGENGRDAMRVEPAGLQRLPVKADADVAEAARAPDGNIWVLLRSKSWKGIGQRIAPLVRTASGYAAGQGFSLPKGAFDNFEGMAIEPLLDGNWRFWLVTDDGHRVMARTLLVALDYVPSARHDKSPATGAGPSK